LRRTPAAEVPQRLTSMHYSATNSVLMGTVRQTREITRDGPNGPGRAVHGDPSDFSVEYLRFQRPRHVPMNSSFRPFISASFGPGLTIFTACSAYFNGPDAVVTTAAFALTVVYGIAETALLSYTSIDAVELKGPSLLVKGSETEESPSGQHNRHLIRFSDSPQPPARAA
jgi:hypothetical protein